MNIRIITPRCGVCGEHSVLEVDEAAFKKWSEGTILIQRAFPEMSPPDREHLKTGMHPKCWDELFGQRP